MLETPHVAVGAALATKIPNPFISIPLALASHIVLDQIPHWNPHSYTEIKTKGRLSNATTLIAVGDVILSLALGFFVASQSLPDYNQASVVILACFASVLPDVSKSPYFLFRIRNGLMKKWVDFERSLQVETSFIPGMLVQITVVIASLWWIFN